MARTVSLMMGLGGGRTFSLSESWGQFLSQEAAPSSSGGRTWGNAGLGEGEQDVGEGDFLDQAGEFNMKGSAGDEGVVRWSEGGVWGVKHGERVGTTGYTGVVIAGDRGAEEAGEEASIDGLSVAHYSEVMSVLILVQEFRSIDQISGRLPRIVCGRISLPLDQVPSSRATALVIQDPFDFPF
jgi:hypothetical protein